MNFFGKKLSVFILLTIAAFVFGYRALPVKAANDVCKCFINFSVKTFLNSNNSFCNGIVDFTSQDNQAAVMQKISDKCGEKGDFPNTDYMSNFSQHAVDTADVCPTKQTVENTGEFKYVADCALIPGEETITDSSAGGSGCGGNVKGSVEDLKCQAKTLNTAGLTGPADLIGRIIKILLAFVGTITLVLYIYAGILWMTASGTTERVDKAKKILVWTTLGVVVMLSSYMLAGLLFKSLGL